MSIPRPFFCGPRQIFARRKCTSGDVKFPNTLFYRGAPYGRLATRKSVLEVLVGEGRLFHKLKVRWI